MNDIATRGATRAATCRLEPRRSSDDTKYNAQALYVVARSDLASPRLYTSQLCCHETFNVSL